MAETERQKFEPGELFIYRKAPGTYELGVVKRDRGDGTYACYYSTGETAAVTHVNNMRKLVNAHWAPIQWARLWGWYRLTLDDLLQVIPEKQPVVVNQNDGETYRPWCYVGSASGVPKCYGDLRVIGVRATSWNIDIEVCDG